MTHAHYRQNLLVCVALASTCAARGIAADDEKPPSEANPYAARAGLSPGELLAFIEKMEAKPKSVGISLDTDREALLRVVAEQGLAWTNLFSDGKPNPAVEKYDIHAIPATFLVDQEGKVVAENVRGPALAKQLEKRLRATTE